MERGLLLKGIGGFYYVLCDGVTVTCKARGALRREGVTPVVGDMVEFMRESSGHALLVNVLERKNLMLRPAVANIDLLLIVLSASAPAPDWLLADKLIVQASLASVKPLLILNKCDCAEPEICAQFDEDYRLFDRVTLSALTGERLDALLGYISGSVCCFAGQSAVGKSSILNALIPKLELPTGELAKKTERGKHTTRHAELWPCFGGAVLDTPGFSLYEEQETIDQGKLDACYPEFALSQGCRFTGCRHLTEPDCGVKALLKEGKLSAGRYERYAIISEEFEYRRKHRYD